MWTARQVVTALGTLAAAATWCAAATQLDRGVFDLLPFTAPGALIGLAVGWLGHAFTRRRFKWRTGLVSALTGMAVLPPWLGVFVVLSSVTAGGLLVLFVAAAWVAVGIGFVLAVVGYAGKAFHAWRTRRTTWIRRRAEWRLAALHRDSPGWRLRRSATLAHRPSPPEESEPGLATVPHDGYRG